MATPRCATIVFYLRSGLHEDNRVASVQYARSALLNGPDDATALTRRVLAGYGRRYRAAAFTALDAALQLSPSSALTHMVGAR